MAIYVNKGTDVNGAWTEVIAISYNNLDWTLIDKGEVKRIDPTFIANVKAAQANRGYKWNDLAVIELKSGGTTVVKFDVQDVVNKAAWNTGAANAHAGLIAAVQEIGTWL